MSAAAGSKRQLLPCRLQVLEASSLSQHGEFINTQGMQLLELHRQLRPEHAGSSLSSSSTYLSLLQSICSRNDAQLLVAFASPPSSSSHSESLIGFLLFSRLHDTFNVQRLLVHDWIVAAEHRGQGVGTAMLQRLRELALETGVRALTIEVHFFFVLCQSILARHRFAVEDLAFNHQPTADPSLLAAAAAAFTPYSTTLVDAANFTSCIPLLTALEPTYRQLRMHLPASTASYLSTLQHVMSRGAFAVVAHPADSPGEALGVAMCRRLVTVEDGERLHVDDLVVWEAKRSTGVGRALMERVKQEARRQAADCGRPCCVTLESGVQRAHAHRFYWREGFYVERLYWRVALPQS